MIDSMTRLLKRCALFLPLLGLTLCLAAPADAGVVAKINLSNQRMDVFVDGRPRYSWPVSTARRGYRTPTGTFKPQSLKVWHRSTIYSGSPMPHSIFFHGGYAIHGSYETKYLGRPASHGCVGCIPRTLPRSIRLCADYGSGKTVIKITY